MASIVHCSKVLQQGLVKQRPHQRLDNGSSAATWRTPKTVSVIGRSGIATKVLKSRRNFALDVPSIRTSRGRKNFATSESVSEIRKVDGGGDTTKVDFKVETQTRLENLDEARDTSAEDSTHSFASEASSQRLDIGLADNTIDGRNVATTDEDDEEETRIGLSTPEGMYRGGSTTDRDGGSENADTDQASATSVAANGTFSISESKRMKRSRIMKELLQRGTSPIELVESVNERTPGLVWTVVNILCLYHRVPEALLVFEWWKRQEGYLASEQQYTGFISICGHAHMPDKAQELFDEMIRLGFKPTVATYTCLLQGFAEAGNFDRAKDILAEMREVGLNPNAITYTGLLLAYGKQGHYSKMAKIFNDMKTYQVSQPECAPTSVTYSALLQCYAKGGLFARMEKTLKEMMSIELDPDGNAINAMIQGYAQAGLVKDMERAYSLVRPFNATVRVGTLRAVALAYIRKSYFYQLGTFARYHNRRRVSMGKLIENLLLLSHAANFSMRPLAEEYVRLKEIGFEGDVTSFNIRALAFSKMQMLWDIRVTILEMVHQNVMPDIVTYGTVVDAYVAGNLQSGLSEVLAEMPNLNCIATLQTDDLVYDAFGRGDFQICCEELLLGSEDIDRRFLTYANLVGYYLKKLEILSNKTAKRKFSKF